MTESPTKTAKKEKNESVFFSKVGVARAHPVFSRVDFFIFLAAEKLTFGGGVQLQSWLGSDHPWAYTSMPQLCFGAKGVCYIEKKVAK